MTATDPDYQTRGGCARAARGMPLLMLVGLCGLAATASAQSTPAPESWLRWRNRPSLQLGPHIRVDLRARLAGDWYVFDGDIEGPRWRLKRAGINGDITDHLQFEVEHDIHPDGRWRDVFVNWQTFRALEVRSGRFKVPFGREQTTSITRVDFAERALASSVIAPARATGIMLHGRFWGRGLTYEVGVFNGDGDNGALGGGSRPGVKPEWESLSLATRVTTAPLRRAGRAMRTLRVGAAMGTVDVPEGLNSLRGESVHETAEFFPPVYVKGRRTRTGLELVYTPGPVGVTAEWMQAREQRRAQGIGDLDLSDVITQGWYVAATWLVTGENKNDFDAPRRAVFHGGPGALELAVRYEVLTVGSATSEGPAFRNPRADHILGNGDRVWTLGMNWFPTRWTRLTANAIHESFDDPVRTPLPGITEFWFGIARLQLAF